MNELQWNEEAIGSSCKNLEQIECFCALVNAIMVSSKLQKMTRIKLGETSGHGLEWWW